MPTKNENRLAEIRSKGMHKREADVVSLDIEARTVQLAFSSEAEYERWWGIEILDHSATSVDMERLNSGAPLLWNHNRDDMRGVVESATIDGDRIGRAVVRFAKDEDGEELFQRIVDRIVTKVSVGYEIIDGVLTEVRDGTEVWRIMSWKPFEISMVSIPADNSVGVGRSAENPPQEPEAAPADTSTKPAVITTVKEDRQMTEEEIAAREQQARAAGHEAEAKRVRTIHEIGERFGHTEAATQFILDTKKTVEDFRTHVLEAQHKREQRPLDQQTRDADIGLTDKETRQFSLVKVVRALSEPTDTRLREAAAFEFEASAAAQKRSGRDTDRFMVPADVLTRALNSTTGGATSADTGGYSIATTLMSQSFVEILRNRAILLQRATTMGGLVGNIDIPRQVSPAQAYWLGEDDDATESELGLGQISMTPKTLAAYSEVTRKLLQQSSLDVEAMVRADLAKVMALAIDKAGFYGTGSDHQPLGLANQTGIHAVSLATAQKPTWGELINMETLIALDNADVDSMTYIGNANFRGYAKSTLKFPGVNGSSTIWEGGAKAKDGTVNGYAADITNQVATGDFFFGNWADLLIGMWGGLEMMVDPFSGSKKGRVRIVTFQDVDIALRRKESFTLAR